MHTAVQPLGLEPVTQYLSHHNNDYHDMQIGNLIGITNACHIDANTALVEFDAQRDQLAKLGAVDVTEYDSFRVATYAATAVIQADFAGEARVANFFAMLTQAHERYAELPADQVTIYAANQQALTIKLSQAGVTVTDAPAAVADYITAVIEHGFTA